MDRPRWTNTQWSQDAEWSRTWRPRSPRQGHTQREAASPAATDEDDDDMDGRPVHEATHVLKADQGSDVFISQMTFHNVSQLPA